MRNDVSGTNDNIGKITALENVAAETNIRAKEELRINNYELAITD